VGLRRRPGFVAAAALTLLVILYMGLVANRAWLLLLQDDLYARGLGFAMLILPGIAAWWLWREWSLGLWVQRMTHTLELRDEVPHIEGPRVPSGRLTQEAAEQAYARASAEVEARPDDWMAWFTAALTYDNAGDRPMARRTYRYAAELFRRDWKR